MPDVQILHMKRKKMPGLPEKLLFQNLENLPAANDVTIEFLEKNVWWWRIPDVGMRMFVKDASEGWPNCELFNNLFSKCLPDRMPRSRKEAQDIVITFASPKFKDIMASWWEDEFNAAKEYELEARDKGSYPCGVPYNQLTRAQRYEWKGKNFRLNLNAIPAIWKEGDPPYNFDTDKLTSVFRVSLGHFASGVSVGVRFNLRHGNGWLTSAFKKLLVAERKRHSISDTEEFRRKDPTRIREFRQFVTNERQRLGIPNPKHEGTDRRPLGADRRSWADIENIDIKTHPRWTNCKTTSRTRQRESVTRRKRLSPHERQLQIAKWKLTALKIHPQGVG